MGIWGSYQTLKPVNVKWSPVGTSCFYLSLNLFSSSEAQSKLSTVYPSVQWCGKRWGRVAAGKIFKNLIKKILIIQLKYRNKHDLCKIWQPLIPFRMKHIQNTFMRHVLIGSCCLLVIVLLPNLIHSDVQKEAHLQETVWFSGLVQTLKLNTLVLLTYLPDS